MHHGLYLLTCGLPINLFAVSVSACVFARTSQKPHFQTSRIFLYVLPVTVARSSSDDNAIGYVMLVSWSLTSLFSTNMAISETKATLCRPTSSFVDDVVFSHLYYY